MLYRRSEYTSTPDLTPYPSPHFLLKIKTENFLKKGRKNGGKVLADDIVTSLEDALPDLVDPALLK